MPWCAGLRHTSYATEDYGEVKPREMGGIPVEYVNRHGVVMCRIALQAFRGLLVAFVLRHAGSVLNALLFRFRYVIMLLQ